MKRILALWLLLLPLAATAQEICPLPDHLRLTALELPATRAAVAGGDLTILVLGGAATAGAMAGDATASMPARLEAYLTAALPGARIRVINAATPRATMAASLERLPALLAEHKAHLLIWAVGGRDAARGGDLDNFLTAVDEGIARARQAKADVILVDTQYAPSVARLINLDPVRTALAGIAAANVVPLLERHDMMMYWNEHRILDLDARDPAARIVVARKLFACLAAALASPIASAAR